MSVDVMRDVWRGAPYKAGTLIVLLALADWSNDDGECFPSNEALAKKSRQSVRNVQYALDTLTNDGFVEVVEDGVGSGNKRRLQLNVQTLHVLAEQNMQKDGKKTCKTRQRNNEEPSESNHQRKRDSLESAIRPFAEKLYEAYPRHIGKGAAIRAIVNAWLRLMKGEGNTCFHNSDGIMSYLLPKVLAFAKSRAGEDPQFTPYPATWFNQSRYLDERVSSETSLFGEQSVETKATVALSALDKVRRQLRGEN